MLNKGRSEEELFTFLAKKKSEDLDHAYILSSMCTLPHAVAVRAHCMFMETNLGDPGLFPGTTALEQLLVRRFADLFHCPGAGGYATSGGTESNIQALRLARERSSRYERPNVVVPDSAHFSFRKACDILGLEMRRVPLTRDYRMDADLPPGWLTKTPSRSSGLPGTTEYGMVDPIAGPRKDRPAARSLLPRGCSLRRDGDPVPR